MKKILLLALLTTLTFSLIGCKKKQVPIDYQECIDVPAMIEINVEEDYRLEDYVTVHNYDDVVKVSFDTDDVFWDHEGDYGINVIVDYRDGAVKTYSSVLRLSNYDTHGKPRIIGIKNRAFEKGTAEVDLEEGVAYTDTEEIVESGMHGTVNYDQEGVYLLEYYAIDNDGNRTSEQAFVIIGDIKQDYLSQIVYAPTAEEKAQLYDYSLLYTMALEGGRYNSEQILLNLGFFATPEVFETLLERQLRQDEINTIYQAQEVFRRNTVRLLREKLDWNMNELERLQLERAYELLNHYVNQQEVSSFEQYQFSFNWFDLAFGSEGLFTDFDRESIELYISISNLYFDKNVLLVEHNTDYEFDLESLDNTAFMLSTSDWGTYNIMQMIYHEQSEGAYLSYLYEYLIEQFLIEYKYVNITLEDMLEMTDIIRQIPQEERFWSYVGSPLPLTMTTVEDILDMEFTARQQDIFEAFEEFYHVHTQNLYYQFMKEYEPYLSTKQKEGIEYLMELIPERIEDLNFYQFNIFNLDFYGEELDYLAEYGYFINFLFNEYEDELYLHAPYAYDFYVLDAYSSLIQYGDIPLLSDIKDTYSIDQMVDLPSDYHNFFYAVKVYYGENLSANDTTAIIDLVIDLYPHIGTYKTIDFIETNIVSDEIREHADPDKLAAYLAFSKQYVDSRLTYMKDIYDLYCFGECQEKRDEFLAQIGSAPLLINPQFYYFPDMYNNTIENQYELNVRVAFVEYKEAIDEDLYRIRINQSEIQYENVDRFENETFNRREVSNLLSRYYDIYNTFESQENFGSPGHLLHQMLVSERPDYTNISDEDKTIIENLYRITNSNFYLDDFSHIFNLYRMMPELVDMDSLLGIINYHKELPVYYIEDDFDELKEKYATSLAFIDTARLYEQNYNILQNIYSIAIHKEWLEDLSIVNEKLVEHGVNIITYRFLSDTIFKDDISEVPWLDTLTEEEILAFEHFGIISLNVRASELFQFVHDIEYNYDSDLKDDIYDFYAELIIAGGSHTMYKNEASEVLGRDLTIKEEYMISWMKTCFYHNCNFTENVQILFRIGMLEGGFTLDEVVTLFEELKETELSEIIDQLPRDMTLDEINLFKSQLLIHNPNVSKSTIARDIIRQTFDEIDIMYEAFENGNFTDFMYYPDMIYRDASRRLDGGIGPDQYYFQLYFYDEEYSDFYLTMTSYLLYTDNYHKLSEAYSRANNYIHGWIDVTEYYTEIELYNYLYQYGKNMQTSVRYKSPYVTIKYYPVDQMMIFKQDPTSELYDLDTYELNLITAEFYTRGYLDRKGTTITTALLERNKELFVKYTEYYSYTELSDIEEIMTELGYTISTEELKFLEDIEEYYDLTINEGLD